MVGRPERFWIVHEAIVIQYRSWCRDIAEERLRLKPSQVSKKKTFSSELVIATYQNAADLDELAIGITYTFLLYYL